MLSRLIIHIRNLWTSSKWIKLNFKDFKNHLESKGLYAPVPFKIFLWKENAKYFRVFNNKGRCFFVKMKHEKDILYESEVLKYLDTHNSEQLDFFPKIVSTIIDEHCYNVFEYLDGYKIDKKSIIEFDLIGQILTIVTFFHRIKIVHRDIRPHNLIVKNGVLRVLDFEHCAMTDKTNNKAFEELNKNFRPENYKWDDAYSFKKIVDQYLIERNFKNKYLELSDMVDKYVYEIN